jgi:hypothetical protein
MRGRHWIVCVAAVGLLCGSAVAQQEVFFDFESPTYSTGNVDGQDGWFESVSEGGAAIIIDTDNGPSDPNGSQCLELNDLAGNRIDVERWFNDVVAGGGRLVTFRYDYREYDALDYYGVDRLNNTWQGHWWNCYNQWNAAADMEGTIWGWADGVEWPVCDDEWHTVEWTILMGDEGADQIGVLLKLNIDGTDYYDWNYPYLGLGYYDAVEAVVLRIEEAYWNVQNDDQLHFDNILIRGEPPPSNIPDADAGPDETLNIGWYDLVTLDGTGSSDDGEIVRYRWSIGGTALLYDGPDPTPQVYLDDGTYTLQLDVWDDDGLRNADLAVYTITKPAILDEVAGPWGTRNADIYGTGASNQIVVDTASGEFEVASQTLVPGPWHGLPSEGDNLIFDQFGFMYFLSWNELLESYDKDLNYRWRANQDGNEKVLGGDIGHNTVVAGVRYIYAVGGDRGDDPNFPGEPKAYAFKRGNGELVWERYLVGEDWSGQPGRPKVTLYNDKLYIVGETVDNYANVHQVDATTGNLDWTSSCLVELQYLIDNNVGGPAFIPDAFGTGLHGLVWNQMSDYDDIADADGYADIAAVMIDPDPDTGGATPVWNIGDPSIPDGPGLATSHPMYSQTTGLVYTPSFNWPDWMASMYAWDVTDPNGLYGYVDPNVGGEHGFRDNFVLDFDGLKVHAPSAFDSIWSYTDNQNGTYSTEYRDYGGQTEHGWGFSVQGALLKNQEGHSIYIVGSDHWVGDDPNDPNDRCPPKIVAVDLSEPAAPGSTPIAEWVAGEYDPNIPADPPWRWTWNPPYAGPTPGPDGSIYFIQADWDWWYEYDRITRLRFKPACPGDLDGDGDTDQADLGILLADWFVDSGSGDLNGDG